MWLRMLTGLAAGLALVAASAFDTEIAGWRRARAAALQADDGWLTLAGLFWLREGANSFGRDPSNAIELPDGPAHAGNISGHLWCQERKITR